MERQKHVRGTVRGRVQGVFFRAATAAKANELGVVGYVRNLADGAVEFEAQGTREAVKALCNWAKKGPPAAKVDELLVEELALEPSFQGFEIRR